MRKFTSQWHFYMLCGLRQKKMFYVERKLLHFQFIFYPWAWKKQNKTKIQFIEFKRCCLSGYVSFSGYHDAHLWKVQTLGFQESIWSMGVFPTRKKCRGSQYRQHCIPESCLWTMASRAMTTRVALGYIVADFEVPGTFYWLGIPQYTIYFSESPRFKLFKNGYRGTQKMTRTQNILISATHSICLFGKFGFFKFQKWWFSGYVSFSGYHDAHFWKVETLGFQKSIWYMGLFATSKKCRGLQNWHHCTPESPWPVGPWLQYKGDSGVRIADFQVPGTFSWLGIPP